VTAAEIARRIEGVQSVSLPWLIAETSGRVAGYAYAAPWKTRTAYRFSVETSVYVEPGQIGRGVGSLLYNELFSILQAKGIHAVIAGISLPNETSVSFHEKFGFQKVGYFREVGLKFNRWIDVGYWQRTT
jgi:L-amino acid N-acyltransferase YncA